MCYTSLSPYFALYLTYNHSLVEHIAKVLFRLTRVHISFFISDVEANYIFGSILSSLSHSPSLPLLSLSCTLLVSPKSKRAVVSPFCLAHL